MKVRRGEVKFEELREALEETEEMLKEAFKNSKLRATPNMEFVNKLMLDIHVSVVPSWMKGGCNG